ncbi:MAG TPA: metal-sensitive transcriptional regulator [Actinomycetota bacterium]|nr:metal-sensitive transcriptional regulator [Actinomycetota bacterium]
MQLEDKVLDDVVDRLRKVEGQVAGIIRMIESERECADVVTQMSAASKALERAGFRLLASGLRHCLADPKAAAKDGYDEAVMERLFMKLA